MSNILEILPAEIIEEIMVHTDVKSAFTSKIVCKAFNSEGIQAIGSDKLKKRFSSFIYQITKIANNFNHMMTDEKYSNYFVLMCLNHVLYIFQQSQNGAHIPGAITAKLTMEKICLFVHFRTNISLPEIFNAWYRLITILDDSQKVYLIPSELQEVFQAFKEYIIGIKREFIFTIQSHYEQKTSPLFSGWNYKYNLSIIVQYTDRPTLRFKMEKLNSNVGVDNKNVHQHLQKTSPSCYLDDTGYIVYPDYKLKHIVESLHYVYGDEFFTTCEIDMVKRISIQPYIFEGEDNYLQAQGGTIMTNSGIMFDDCNIYHKFLYKIWQRWYTHLNS